jgi:hypothetical protein
VSIYIMTMVFQRYKGGPGETLLALALADCASDDGSRIYPSVSEMSRKTRQSERTVQSQLKRMIATSWLIRRAGGDGGRSRTTSYCINPMWIKGAELAPFAEYLSDADMDEADAGGMGQGGDGATSGRAGGIAGGQKGADSAGFTGADSPPETPQIMSLNPANSAGAIEPNEPLVNTPLPPQGEMGLAGGDAEPPKPHGVQATARAAPKSKRLKASKGPVGLSAYLALCKAQGVRAVPEGCAVLAYVDTVGITPEVFALHWSEFKARHIESDQRQRDWLKTLLNSVRGNWYGLWIINTDGACVLTTKGVQAQRFHAKRGDE